MNRRLGVVRCLYRFHYGREIPPGQTHFARTYRTRSPVGYGRPRRAVASGLRLRQPRRVVVPLSAEEVAQFWRSFRTFRDLALVGLMLLDGLRSCEVLALQLEDLSLADTRGPGSRQGKQRAGLAAAPGTHRHPAKGRFPPQDDQRLQQELRRTDDLASHALLLTRATGIRIGECIDLPLDCLRPVGSDQWALHVPLGKLHTERLVPVDEEGRRIVARILALRAVAPPARLVKSHGLLLPRGGGHHALYQTLLQALAEAAQRAGCSSPLTPHQLRHTYATEMLRLGVSLPALMQLLGHKDIRMTLRYVQVTQADLQREYHLARQNIARLHPIAALSLPDRQATADLAGLCQALAATRHLLEMYRRQLRDEKTRRGLQRLDRRLRAVAEQLDRIATALK